MSPLAGPVAAAAVILAPGTRIPEVDDSKRLDAETRERLAPVIKQRAVAWAVAFAEVEEIDRINIYWAGLAAMRRAIAALAPAAEHLLIDGRRLPGARAAAGADRGRRRQEPVDRGGVDPGQDRARRAHAGARRRSIPATASPSTRGTRCRRTPARSRSWAPAPSTGGRSRWCARRSGLPPCPPGPRPRRPSSRRVVLPSLTRGDLSDLDADRAKPPSVWREVLRKCSALALASFIARRA